MIQNIITAIISVLLIVCYAFLRKARKSIAEINKSNESFIDKVDKIKIEVSKERDEPKSKEESIKNFLDAMQIKS